MVCYSYKPLLHAIIEYQYMVDGRIPSSKYDMTLSATIESSHLDERCTKRKLFTNAGNNLIMANNRNREKVELHPCSLKIAECSSAHRKLLFHLLNQCELDIGIRRLNYIVIRLNGHITNSRWNKGHAFNNRLIAFFRRKTICFASIFTFAHTYLNSGREKWFDEQQWKTFSFHSRKCTLFVTQNLCPKHFSSYHSVLSSPNENKKRVRIWSDIWNFWNRNFHNLYHLKNSPDIINHKLTKKRNSFLCSLLEFDLQDTHTDTYTVRKYTEMNNSLLVSYVGRFFPMPFTWNCCASDEVVSNFSSSVLLVEKLNQSSFSDALFLFTQFRSLHKKLLMLAFVLFTRSSLLFIKMKFMSTVPWAMHFVCICSLFYVNFFSPV